MTRPKLFRAISGPTGVGKTDFALRILEIAPDLKIFNADAFQFYREIPILSNQEKFPPHIKTKYFGYRSISQAHSAGEFSKEVLQDLNEEALWVGTGLYLSAALYGLDEDGRKGTPFQGEARMDYRILVLTMDRASLYQKLNERVDKMLEAGALEEARHVLQMIHRGEVSPDAPPLKAIGLKHLLAFLRKEMSWEDCIEQWKQDTRRLAKRQWTWLKKFCAASEKIRWLDPDEIRGDLKNISSFLEI